MLRNDWKSEKMIKDPEKELTIRIVGYSQDLLTRFVNDLDEFLKQKNGVGISDYNSPFPQKGDLIQQDFKIQYEKKE